MAKKKGERGGNKAIVFPYGRESTKTTWGTEVLKMGLPLTFPLRDLCQLCGGEKTSFKTAGGNVVWGV